MKSSRNAKSCDRLHLCVRIAFCAVLISVAALGTAAQEANGSGSRDYPMLDSRFPAEDFWPTAWIDNDRVLFTGVVLGKSCDYGQLTCSFRGVVNAMYVWDVRNNRVAHYRDRLFAELCLQQGYISYTARDDVRDNLATAYAGPFGAEKKVLGGGKHWLNPMSCKYHVQQPDWAAKRQAGRDIEPLLEKHGYIDYGPRNTVEHGRPPAGSRPRIVGPDGDTFPIHVASEHWPTVKHRLKYLPFLDQYFAEGRRNSHARSGTAVYIFGDARTYVFTVQLGRNLDGEYHPVRPGILVNSGGMDNRGTGGGAYLLSKRQHVTRILHGALRSVSVSPNGCRIAFVYAESLDAISEGYRSWQRGRPANTLRAIDLCPGG